MRHLFIRAWMPGRWRRWITTIGGVGIAAGLAYLLLSDRSGPRLELVALGADGGYSGVAEIPGEWVDTTTGALEVAARIPLVVGVRNLGGEAARPGRLSVSVPMNFRLRAGSSGRLSRRVSAAGPLIEYRVEGSLPEVPPDDGSGRPVVWDTLSLDVVVPAFYCVAMADSVPTFIPAPPVPVELLADVRMFYSLSGGDLRRRQTGLLRVRIDPSLLRRPDRESMPTYRTAANEPEAGFPALEGLRHVGSRRALCGEPARPLEFLVVLWETAGGGRFFVIHYGGVPRKYLFDLDRDGMLELEMGDPDGDGRFEAASRLSMRIPRFLMPPTGAVPYDPATLDSLPYERRIALDVFRDAMRGPYRPIGPAPDTTPDLAVFRPDRRARTPGDIVARPRRPPAPPRAGQRADRRMPRVLGEPVAPAADAPGAAPRRPVEPGAEARPLAPEARPRPEGGEVRERAAEPPRLLGVPVDSIRPAAPPDTTGGG